MSLSAPCTKGAKHQPAASWFCGEDSALHLRSPPISLTAGTEGATCARSEEPWLNALAQFSSPHCLCAWAAGREKAHCGSSSQFISRALSPERNAARGCASPGPEAGVIPPLSQLSPRSAILLALPEKILTLPAPWLHPSLQDSAGPLHGGRECPSAPLQGTPSVTEVGALRAETCSEFSPLPVSFLALLPAALSSPQVPRPPAPRAHRAGHAQGTLEAPNSELLLPTTASANSFRSLSPCPSFCPFPLCPSFCSFSPCPSSFSFSPCPSFCSISLCPSQLTADGREARVERLCPSHLGAAVGGGRKEQGAAPMAPVHPPFITLQLPAIIPSPQDSAHCPQGLWPQP